MTCFNHSILNLTFESHDLIRILSNLNFYPFSKLVVTVVKFVKVGQNVRKENVSSRSLLR